MAQEFSHVPVLYREVMQQMDPARGGRYIDCTLGGGGHSGMMLAASEDVKLLGLDQDENALAAATAKLAQFGERFDEKAAGVECTHRMVCGAHVVKLLVTHHEFLVRLVR